MEKIKISVVIPVYNTADYIEECLDSLLVQDYKSVEYILVDDGSTDSSLEICKKYAERDERFVVVHKENGGPSSARNLAMEMARGEYITFVDSDDSLCDDAYTVISKKLEKHNNPDILVFGANLFPDNAPEYLRRMVSPRDIAYSEFTPDILFDEIGSRPFLWLQVVKKSLITENELKMDESMNLGEDQLFQIELFPNAKSIVYTSERLYNYRWVRPDSLMNDYGAKIKKKLLMHVKIIDKVFDSILTDKYDDAMKLKTFTWSVFFMWGDVVNLLEYDQVEVCSALKSVWEKHSYKDYYDRLGVWARLRVDQLILLGETDKNKKIENLEAANTALEKRMGELMLLPECRRLARERTSRAGKIKMLIRKFRSTVKSEGFLTAIRKGWRKIREKLA